MEFLIYYIISLSSTDKSALKFLYW